MICQHNEWLCHDISTQLPADQVIYECSLIKIPCRITGDLVTGVLCGGWRGEVDVSNQVIIYTRAAARQCARTQYLVNILFKTSGGGATELLPRKIAV